MLFLWLSHNRIILRYSTFSYTYDYQNINLWGRKRLARVNLEHFPFSVNSPYESKLGSEWKGIFLSKALVCPLCHYMRKKLFAALMLFCCCPNKFSTRASSLPLSPLQGLDRLCIFTQISALVRELLSEKPDQFFTLPPRHVGAHNENA